MLDLISPFSFQNTSDPCAVTRVVSHPTLPLTITAHEDRQIRFFDNSTGKMTHAMVAHLDAVTSLSIDNNGLYLISGSECATDHHVNNCLELPRKYYLVKNSTF